jgi:hypothetical protein
MNSLADEKGVFSRSSEVFNMKPDDAYEKGTTPDRPVRPLIREKTNPAINNGIGNLIINEAED